jgi:hypothetical protein
MVIPGATRTEFDLTEALVALSEEISQHVETKMQAPLQEMTWVQNSTVLQAVT